MRKSFNILIIDPFPIALLGYKICLNEYDKEFSFNLVAASSIKEALAILNERTAIFFHAILLDVDMKKSVINGTRSGEVLAKRIKINYPQTKIIALTERKNSFRLYQIEKDINPDALIIKAELKKEMFLNAIETVLAEQNAFGEKVSNYSGKFYCS